MELITVADVTIEDIIKIKDWIYKYGYDITDSTQVKHLINLEDINNIRPKHEIIAKLKELNVNEEPTDIQEYKDYFWNDALRWVLQNV